MYQVTLLVSKNGRPDRTKSCTSSHKGIVRHLCRLRPTGDSPDNGPPFNSSAFEHPQGNPVEKFMRPLGKSMKAAHFNKQNKDEALNQMLSNYRATPHPSTGLPPGDVMFRSGYKKDFPRQTTGAKLIKESLKKDQAKREEKSTVINSSNHRTQTNVSPGDQVIFGPDIHKFVEIRGNEIILIHLSDDKIMKRHLDDVKLASSHNNHNVKTLCHH